MQNGDLSNVIAPRLIIVFEGAVGHLPENRKKDFDKAVKKNQMEKAFSMFELKEMMIQKILYMIWKKNFNISLVTWMGDDAAIEIENIMIMNSVPVRGCFATKPAILARMLPYNPDIACIYDPDPEHILMFGSKGQVLKNPSDIGRMF